MSDFATYSGDRKKLSSEAYCHDCELFVQVNVNAEPHLQIAGPAPRFKCSKGL